MLARRLAEICGLNTVVVAGGDVGPLGAAASFELSRLMRWAGGGGGGGGCGGGVSARRKWKGRGGRGVALVMDEADAALCDRR